MSSIEDEIKGYKYINYLRDADAVLLAVPRPDGTKSTYRLPHRADAQLLRQRAVEMRDKLGIALWGEDDWWRLLTASRRPTPRRSFAGKREPGLTHEVIVRENADTGRRAESRHWIVRWSQDNPAGKGRVGKTKLFSYGGPRSAYPDEKAAREAAYEWRRRMYNQHYLGVSRHK